MTRPELGCRALVRAIGSGQLSAREAVDAALGRLEEIEGLGAVSEVFEDAALERARALDDGPVQGPLHGVPIAVKDNICTTLGHTRCGSRLLDDYRSPFEATAVARLQAAGAVVVARTRCDEFGMGSSGENCAHGATKNPWDTDRVPGGSSSGSAAVVAAGAVPLALGSDTGGSVRQPAAFCGVVGLKPGYARVSRRGLVAFGSSLDQIGPLTHNADDAALALSLMAGADPLDASCRTEPVPDLEGSGSDAAGLRIGLVREFREAEDLEPDAAAAVDRVASDLALAGAVVDEVSLPLARHGLAIYYLIASAEASSNLARFDGVRYGRRAEDPHGDLGIDVLISQSRREGLGLEVRRRILLGTFALSAGYHDDYYGRALKARAALRGELLRALETFDLLLGPTTAGPAFRLGERSEDPVAMYRSDLFTVPASVAGLGAISLPAPSLSRGLPLGLQLMAAPLREDLLLRGARALETLGCVVRTPGADV